MHINIGSPVDAGVLIVYKITDGNFFVITSDTHPLSILVFLDGIIITQTFEVFVALERKYD